ncbi:MAG: GGDEF domain-containing protein [Candidatus Adiutrix sp.]|jgi:diguanylate cyclase (GGDEF)-like protein|nr:GGDEF domain-containing protein [Candidatus Adiutrix sp.]
MTQAATAKESAPGPGCTAAELVDFLEKQLLQYNGPEPSPEMLLVPGLERLCAYINEIKAVLAEFSAGRFDRDIKCGGNTAGLLKALRGNIRHLTWQCLMVAEGDLSQRVDFMGEFADAFNRMTASLAEYRDILEQKQTELLAMTETLRQEVKLKEDALLALAASEETYRQKSLRDSMTGIYNRGYFFETAEREMENLKRSKDDSLCLLMIDIDHFKIFNDTYGHLCGDQVIKMVTGAIDRILRKSDIFARYGGEEFVLMLPAANLNRGRIIAERIRMTIANSPSPARDGQSITISIGLVCINQSELNPATSGQQLLLSAIERADIALYSAKTNGRNCVSLYTRA